MKINDLAKTNRVITGEEYQVRILHIIDGKAWVRFIKTLTCKTQFSAFLIYRHTPNPWGSAIGCALKTLSTRHLLSL